jgi:hypothetical protein
VTGTPAKFPGSDSEYLAQELYGTRGRADRFYRDQLLDVLTPQMAAFIAEQREMVVSTVDPDGHPDTSVRFGEAGFVTVLDERTLVWPELRGNGVFTTLGNLLKNPAAHLMFLDRTVRIGLHLRGQARVLDPDDLADEFPHLTPPDPGGRAAERFVVLHLATCYVHCRKHFPRQLGHIALRPDAGRAKGGDYFGAKDTRSPWS